MSTTLETVNGIVLDVLPELDSSIDPQARLGRDLGVDSLSVVDIIVKVEKAFDITVDEEELAQVESIQDIVDLLARRN